MAPHQSRASCGPERVWPAERDSGSRSCGRCRSPQTLIWCPEEGGGGVRGRRGGEEDRDTCILGHLIYMYMYSAHIQYMYMYDHL